MNSVLRWLLSAPVALTLALGLALPARAATVNLTYDFPAPELVSGADGRVIPRFPGAVMDDSLAGAPVMPKRVARVVIPAGHVVKEVRVAWADPLTLAGTYQVVHSQGFVPLSYEGEAGQIGPDPGIYQSATPYPYQNWRDLGVQSLHSYRIVMVELWPVSYIPAAGTLSYSPQATLTVLTQAMDDGAGEDPYLASPFQALGDKPPAGTPGTVSVQPRNGVRDLGAVLSLVDNPSDVAVAAPEPSPLGDAPLADLPLAGSRQYLIITTNALAATFQTLANHRASGAGGGYGTHIETVENIGASYPGRDLAEKIRNYIIESYNSFGTEFVLLGGDADGAGGGSVPSRGCYATTGSYTDNNIPSDLYYACLDGDWNSNNNSLWGESNDGPGGADIDWLPEVYVGRIAADNATEAANHINKIITYEMGFHQAKALMVGELMDSNPTWGGDRMDYVYGFMNNYPHGELYDRNGTWSKATLINLINSDQYDWINHLGHSNNTYGLKFSSYDLPSFSNSSYVFIYTQGCYAGAFDNRWSSGSYGSSDSITESLTNSYSDRGAFAMVANSRYGWYNPGSFVAGASNLLHRYFVEEIIGGNNRLGPANHSSKTRLSKYGVYRWIAFETNLFGDPATPYLTQPGGAVPPDIRVSATSHDFGTMELGQSAQWTLTIYNDGEGPLYVTSLSGLPSYGFSLVNPPAVPFSVAPGESLDLTVNYAATYHGPRTAHLNLTHTDYGDSPTTVTLTATDGKENQALNGTASQSSTLEGIGAERAIDGDSDGVWANQSVSSTEYQASPWWQVDLGTVCQLEQIQIWPRTASSATAWFTDFYLFVSDVPFESEDLNATINQAGVSAYHIAGTCAQPQSINMDRTGRFIRVQLVDSNYLQIAEVEVWGSPPPPAPPVIVAIPDATGYSGQTYRGATPALSQGTAPITWSLVEGPAGMGIDAATGIVTWGAPALAGSPHTVTIRATNAQGSDDESWQVTVEEAPTNLALTGSASQSSTLIDIGASRAIDGDSDGIWANGSVSSTNIMAQPWWQVDLGAVCDIGQIQLWPRTASSATSWFSDFFVLVSDTPFVSTDLSTAINQEGVTAYHIGGTCQTPQTLAVGRSGRYVRVQLVGTNYLQIAEVQVWGSPPAPVAPAIAAINDANAWAGLAYTGPTPSLDQGSGAITWSLAAGPAGMTIDAATGVVSWANPTAVGSPHTVTIRASNSQGQDDETWQLTVEEAPTNLALTGSASQSSTLAGIGPQLAIDNSTDGLWANGSVSSTDLQSAPWWQVDLGAVCDISQVQLWPRTASSASAWFSDFYVLVSDAPFASTDLTATINQAGVSSYHVQGTCALPESVAVGRSGRYVRVQLTGFTYLQIAEVQVWGSPPAPVAPVIAAIDDASAWAGLAYTGPTPSLSAGNGSITWSLSAGPAGMTIDPATGVVAWANPTAVGSPHTVTIRAANSAGNDEESWALTVAEAPENLALAGTATQSSTLVGIGAGRAIDNNTDGIWANGSVSSTNLQAQPWWQVDLGAVSDIEQIQLWPRTASSATAWFSNFYVLVSDTPFASTDLTTTINQAGVSSYHIQGTCAEPQSVAVGRSGRYVRVQLVGSSYLQIAEVQVWGAPPEPLVPVIAAIDDDSAWAGQPYTGPTPSLTQGTGSITWSLSAGPAGMSIDPATGVVSWAVPTQVGSPHTVTIRATNSVGNDEETWAVSVGEAPTNLALTGIATQSTTLVGIGADRAIDDNTDGLWANGSVSSTNTQAQSWWQVDLQSVCDIQEIQLWPRTASSASAWFSNFYVLVSDTPFASTDLAATINQAGVSSYHIAGTCAIPQTIAVGRTGRYVRVQLAGTNYLQIAEVQVWGTWGEGGPPAGGPSDIGTMVMHPVIDMIIDQGGTDSDGDGMADQWELDHFGSLARDGSGDLDHDGLGDLAEYQAGTDPNQADSDGDGTNDGDEVASGRDPLEPDAFDPGLIQMLYLLVL